MTLLQWYVLLGLPLILIGGAFGAVWLTRIEGRDRRETP